jgi:hypothetical protein
MVAAEPRKFPPFGLTAEGLAPELEAGSTGVERRLDFCRRRPGRPKPLVHMGQMGRGRLRPGRAQGHPVASHRGFETVTYMIDGVFRHQDSNGGGGLITDEAEAGPAITLLCPCPGVCASQLASKPPATRPRNTTRCTVSRRSHPPAEQRGHEVTRGKVMGCERLAHRWHARGQGFKSPQLHQAQRISHSSIQRRLPAICQQ